MNRKISKLLQPSVQLYFVILILFALASALFSIPLAVLEAVVVLILGLYTRTSGHKRRREITKYIENITGNVDVATKDTMVNSPLPMVIFRPESDDIIWTNEPVMGVVTRLAARKSRKKGTKVIYMVHGFHFYKGAPKINWMVFYPIERIMALYTDVICTVNQEDYARAKKMNVKRVEYIHGIGINTERLSLCDEKNNIRKELGLAQEDFIVLSVGELNKNKNQKIIIQAIELLKDPQIHYILCGKGEQMNNLKKQVKKAGLDNNVHFLGYRKDVVDICSQSDVFVMPSFREGLPVASLEAMYCGLPLVTSNIRGLVDIIEEGVSGYLCNPDDIENFAKGIVKLKIEPNLRERMAKRNKDIVVPYCVENTKQEVFSFITHL